MTQKTILVIGGGISGITTAVEAAEVGHKVILVEKLPYLGGRVAKMNQYFPKLCPPYCGLEINFKRIKNNQNIDIFVSTEVENISGKKGDFKVSLKTAAKLVNENCTTCGECEKVCSVEIDNEFNYNLDKTKAIYLPHEMAFPWKHTIDEKACLGESCNKCVEVCKYNAIDLNQKELSFDLDVDSIVVATGWKPYDASKIENLNYKNSADIISNVEMERLAAPNGNTLGKIVRLSDNKEVRSIAFVQCAGSRDENHLAYCSGVCCSASLKQALNLREVSPDIKIKIFYIDLRVLGRNEDILKKVEADENIELIKGKVGRVNINKNGSLQVEAEDIMKNKKVNQEFDMVVLATGIVPEKLENSFIKYDDYEFVDVEKLENGIFVTACARKPLDVSASVKDATGVVLKAIQG
ncbi:MAG: CoB--CoM heterodisulfide reductase iron-sulfur subunit A family protein [Bacteroidetes bacterium]|nr:CoB--CoM heterodisulfide reductase iron-sulfur subunit A family protein [Bacteroidota bacterium]